MRRSISILLMGWVALSLLACEETPPDVVINQLDRPGSVGVVCYSRDAAGQFEQSYPLDCCRSTSQGVAGHCSVPLITPSLATFLTQTTSGEVGVIDAGSGDIVDQDLAIPLNSFIPVGGQPADLVVSWDGARVFTANIETKDISVIEVSEAFGPRMVPARAIDVEYAAARIELAPEPFRDRVAFVSQPTVDRIAVVALSADDCPATSGSTAPGCLLGYLPLTDTVTPVFPTATAISSVHGLLYVAGGFAPVLYEIDAGRLAQEALDLAAPGPLTEAAIVRRISTDTFRLSRLSVEPDLERFLYGIEAQGGGVVVVDLLAGELIEVAANDPNDPTPYTLNLQGRADSLTVERLVEFEDASPLTFNGTFAFVAASDANLYVIDVQDMDDPGSPSHVLRSAVAFDGPEFSPRVDTTPVLLVDEQQLSPSQAVEYVSITPRDDLVTSCADGAYYQPENEDGIHLPCDARNTVNDMWQAVWQGVIGAFGAALVDYGFAADATEFEVRDPNRNFLASGVLAGAGPVSSCAVAPFVVPDSYTGDWLEITLNSEQEEDPDCEQFLLRPLVYQIVELVDNNTVRLSSSNFDNPTPLPTRACFGPAFNYQVRAAGHWVLRGLETGDEHLACPQRIWPDGTIPFENRYLSLVLTNGPEGPASQMELQWETVGGFRPLLSFLGDYGNKVNDMVLTPGNNLIMVDQAEDRMIFFDLLGEFVITATPPIS